MKAFLTAEELEIMSCDEVTSEENWNEAWTECPVCHCKPDENNHWVHQRRDN